MLTDAVQQFVDAWRTLHGPPPSAPGGRARRNNAARTVAGVADVELTRILGVRLVPPSNSGSWFDEAVDHTGRTTMARYHGEDHSAFDWDRLRVNVAHLVAPQMVRWK